MAKLVLSGATLAVLSLSLTACGRSDSGTQRVLAAPDADPHTAAAWQPSPAAPGEVVFPGVGVRYRPTDETAPVAASEAIKVASEAPYAHTLTITPTATLARATDDDFAPGSGETRHHENVLAWVVTYHQTLPALHRSSTAPANCDFIVIVDAEKASVLDVFQVCPPP